MKIEAVLQELKNYDGREIKLMEVCGTHTSAIFKSGIRSMISPKIKLISGPGCPVCVTPTAYIDACLKYAMMDNHVLYTFGDMMKVPGSEMSLADGKGQGAKVEIMYSPLDLIKKAEGNKEITYVVAAVGFETTAPTYALLLSEAISKGIKNIKLVTALKTVIPALTWICENESQIDGFLCPGHVSVITGSSIYDELAIKYNKPFTVTGFSAEHILASIYASLKQIQGLNRGKDLVKNLYTNAVKEEGNKKAIALINEYYKEGKAMWRGLGMIENSGLYLKEQYENFDGGSFGLDSDMKLPKECRCGDVIVGRINPKECAMFGKSCTPSNPYGPCMVSQEGACGIWYKNGGQK